uniref:Uncharacterized protein n=1 Tax=Arion vulgaris TaxID=1028688 RepID=A0A0B6Z8V0_9EUPU
MSVQLWKQEVLIATDFIVLIARQLSTDNDMESVLEDYLSNNLQQQRKHYI